MTTDDDLLTYAEAELELNIARPTLYTMVHRRVIPHIRLARRMVRFRRGDLRQWLQEHHVPAAAQRRGK